MKGYWGDPDRTAEVLVEEHGERWMHTGDEAVIDEEGYVSITGRIKDLIIRGGENIHPLEVENVVFGVKGVREVSVVGLPDERLGEGVAAFVVLKDGWRGEGEDGCWGGGDSGDGMGENAVEGGKGLPVGGHSGKKVLKKEDIKAWVREKLSGHLVPKWVFWVQE